MKCKLYLPDEIKAAGCKILKRLTNLPEIDADAETLDRLQSIEKVYLEVSAPTHPVIAMKKMQDIPGVQGC